MATGSTSNPLQEKKGLVNRDCFFPFIKVIDEDWTRLVLEIGKTQRTESLEDAQWRQSQRIPGIFKMSCQFLAERYVPSLAAANANNKFLSM
jgi:hypothetical protein